MRTRKKGWSGQIQRTPLFVLFRFTHWGQLALRNVGCSRTALRMSPSTLTDSLLLAVLRGDVINDIVGMGCIATYASRDIVEMQCRSGAPANVMIGAG